jgi:hypothetical protein
MRNPILRSILFILGVGFILALAYNTRQEIIFYFTSTNWLLFSTSVLIGTAGYIISGTYFKNLIEKHGDFIDSSASRRMLLNAQIIKYIPGKIWTVIYQMSLLRGIKSSRSVILANTDLMIISIVMVTSVSLGLLALSHSVVIAVAFVLLGGSFFVLAAESCAISKGAQYIIKILSKIKISPDQCRSPRKIGSAVLYYVVFSITYSLSQILMLYSVFGLSIHDSFTYAGYLGLAWIIGSLSIIIPGGLGIKEAAFVFIAHETNSQLDVNTVISIAIVARLWTILQELIGIMCAYIEGRLISARNKKELLRPSQHG